jgi:hypothetical protein
MDVREYLKVDGTSPFGDWFAGLDPQAAAKVTIVLVRLGQGNFSKVKGVGSGVFEYVLDFGPWLPDLHRQGRRTARHPAGRRHQEAAAARHRRREGLLG